MKFQFVSKNQVEYGWVICNHSNEFMMPPELYDYMSPFIQWTVLIDMALVFSEKYEAEDLLKKLKESFFKHNGYNLPYCCIKQVKVGY